MGKILLPNLGVRRRPPYVRSIPNSDGINGDNDTNEGNVGLDDDRA